MRAATQFQRASGPACPLFENDYHSLVDATATLDELPIGAVGTVAAVGCPRPVARRLMEMGLLPGTRVAVVRVAPFGDPIQLRLRSYALSIRRREASAILIEDVHEAVPATAPAEHVAS